MAAMTVAFISVICAICGFFLGLLVGSFCVLDAEMDEIRKAYDTDVRH